MMAHMAEIHDDAILAHLGMVRGSLYPVYTNNREVHLVESGNHVEAGSFVYRGYGRVVAKVVVDGYGYGMPVRPGLVRSVLGLHGTSTGVYASVEDIHGYVPINRAIGYEGACSGRLRRGFYHYALKLGESPGILQSEIERLQDDFRRSVGY